MNGMRSDNNYEKPNKLLLESIHDHLQLLHDSELNIGAEDSKQFLKLLFKKHNTGNMSHLCPLYQCLESCK